MIRALRLVNFDADLPMDQQKFEGGLKRIRWFAEGFLSGLQLYAENTGNMNR